MPVMKQQHTANLVCALLFIFGAVSACREEAKPRLFNRLIFLSRQSGDYDVRLRTTNDRQPVELGRVVPWDSQPFWSPDGTRIAFYSDRNFNLADRDNNVDIYTMSADGTSLTRLTDDPTSDAFPYWSPEGMGTWTCIRSSLMGTV